MKKSDLELLSAMKGGDYTAFHEIYARYSPRIYKMIEIRIHNSLVVDDIFQDFFIKLWVNRENIVVNSNVEAYMMVSLKNHILNSVKSDQIRIRYEQSASEFAEKNEDMWNHIIADDLHLKTNAIVDKFPPKLRQIYRLSREENLSISEIAKQLSISEQTVKNQISESLRRLKQEIRSKNFIV